MNDGYDPVRVFRKLARNNALANARLHRVLQLLSPEEFVAPRTGFFPSLRKTLNHILTVDWFYVDALEGGTLGFAAFDVEEPCDTLADLVREQDKVDGRLVRLVDSMNADRLTAIVQIHRGPRVQRDRADDVLSHLFQHQTHHRGQAHAMLSGTSVAPPQLDEFIVGDDARFRGEDMAAVGWSEAELMR
ncbi:DinB family protein [Rhizobium sp. LjRoot30]|uniref:DinB family protein n=1 Tax=Rhizobium sp. LjRoot30 TaxID=3342320 RepID=UPI003ED108DA